jgi:glycosyltransferase involved in cell wall biosynthesis
MDEHYFKIARVLHVDARILNRPAFTPSMAGSVADDIVALIGPIPSHIEATGVPDTYFASLLANRLPDSDYSLMIIRPGTVLSRAWPSWGDIFPNPLRFWDAINGRKENGILRVLAESNRVLSVNRACAIDAGRLAGVQLSDAIIEPVIIPFDSAVVNMNEPVETPYILTVARLDGKMKSYVGGLIRNFAILADRYPGLRLKIVGDGPDRPRLLSLASQEGVGKRVDFEGTLDPLCLGPLYKGALVFVGMGTAAVEAAFHSLPVVIATAYNPSSSSPGYFGQINIEGFGEQVLGQPTYPLEDLLVPLLDNRVFRESVAKEGCRMAFANHHPDTASDRMHRLLSRAPVTPAKHPYPLPKWRHLLFNWLRGVGRNRPLAWDAAKTAAIRHS